MSTSLLSSPRVVFFGSGSFATPILSRLIELSAASSCELCMVITQDIIQDKRKEDETNPDKKPDKIGGNEASRATSFPMLHAPRFDEQLYARLRETRADLFITASYGFRFPRAYLDLATYGSYNLHASLLPRWRGSSPIQHSILHGDKRSGVTLIRMDERIDCGGIVRQASLDIGCNDSYKDLESRLAVLGASELEDFLVGGCWREKPLGAQQVEGAASYARKLHKGDGLIDWSLSAEFLSCMVRAFSPWPGTAFFAAGRRVLLHAARVELPIEGRASKNGEVLRLSPYPIVRCGGAGVETVDKTGVAVETGALGLLSLQRAGGRVCAAADFLRGFPMRAGMVLGGKD